MVVVKMLRLNVSVLYLTKEPASVEARCVEDRLLLLLTFASGVRALHTNTHEITAAT